MPSERQNPNPLVGIHHLLLSRGAHLTLGVLTVLAVLFCGWDATRTRPSDGTVWLLGRANLEVLDILPGGSWEPTPLQRGDLIIGIDRTITPSPQKAAEELRRHQPGTRVSYMVRRDNKQKVLDVPLRSTRVDLGDYAIDVLLATVYLLIGFAVYVRSTADRAAGLFFVLCLLFGLYFMTNLHQSTYFLGALITQNIGAFARFMLPSVFLHFFLVFPYKKLWLTRHPFLAPLLYILPLMFYMRFTLDQFIGREGANIGAMIWIVLGIYYMLGLAALLHSYYSYRDPLLRQRVRILTFGTLAAVVPFLIFKIGLEELQFRTELTRLGAVPLVMIPISFGYCVARYQILQIDLLLRRNLAYSLLSAAVWISYLAGAWWLGGRLLTLLPAAGPLVAAGATLAVVAALWPLRVWLQRNLDRRFYHSRDNMATLLEEFSREIPRLIQREALVTRVGTRLTESLSLPGVAVYLARTDISDRHFDLVAACNPPAPALPGNHPHTPAEPPRVRTYPDQLVLPALSLVLESRGEPFWADTGDAREILDRQTITREQADLKARAAEQVQLEEHGIQLLVPLVAQERLVGIFALPRRPGDDTYEIYELQILTIVASQVALQVENARLYEEEVTKQKLEEEMANARRIQARLMPRNLPQLEGVDIEAVNISSKQVSGDYYDVVEREDGQLALIIADVSGKGMPASILASNLQAALRAQCDNCDEPAVVLARINRQIHASTDPQHFATLFLAFYRPLDRTLRYSSGGHNPPVVMRADGRVELLEAGGLPLGAFDFGTYEEGEITLDEGDLLFLYTDGLTETKGPDGDEDFGENRLNELLSQRREDSVGDIFTAVKTGLYDFSGRVDADDDITMLGLKIAGADQVSLREAGGVP